MLGILLLLGCATNIVNCAMQNPVVVTIDQTKFDYIVSIAQIIGAIGAAAAAVTSVWLANRQNDKETLEVEPEMSNGKNHYQFVVDGVDNTTNRALIWIGVKNVSPSSSIHNCQVYVDSIFHNATGQSTGRRYKLLCNEHARSLEWSRTRTPNVCQAIDLAKQIPQFACIAEISNPPSVPQSSKLIDPAVTPPCNVNPSVPQLCIKIGNELGTRIDKNPQDVLVKFFIAGDGLDCKIGFLQLIWKGTKNSDLSDENRHLLEAAVLTPKCADTIIMQQG